MVTERIAVIGAGMMGSAIVTSFVKGGYTGKITVADFQLERLKEMAKLGVNAIANNRKAAAKADIVFVVVKPAAVEKVLTEIRKEVAGKLVVSVAGTVPLKFLENLVPEARFVRIMPNVAAIVQAAYTAYSCDAYVTEKDKIKVKALLDMMGVSAEINEKYMDAITAVSGSGPGFLSIIVEALMYAGLHVGLPRDIALASAAQAFLGTGKLILYLQEHPAKIRDMVTTPGGTTIDAIYEVEGSQIRQGLVRAVEAATKKSSAIREKLGLDSQ